MRSRRPRPSALTVEMVGGPLPGAGERQAPAVGGPHRRHAPTRWDRHTAPPLAVRPDEIDLCLPSRVETKASSPAGAARAVRGRNQAG